MSIAIGLLSELSDSYVSRIVKQGYKASFFFFWMLAPWFSRQDAGNGRKVPTTVVIKTC